MRTAMRFMGIVFLGMVLLLAADAVLTVQREQALFDRTMRRNAVLLGSTLREAVLEVWKAGGQQQVLGLIRRVDQRENHMRVRWVWYQLPAGRSLAPRVAPARLAGLAAGRPLSVRQADPPGPGHLYTYVPVCLPDGRCGAIEVAESLSEPQVYFHRSIWRAFVLACILTAFSGVMLWVLGRRIIGRPLDELMCATQQIGQGDFSGTIEMAGSGEFTRLARAMNEMRQSLAKARTALEEETQARIETLEQLRHTERLATLGRLSSGIAHELGTPLNVVAGRAKLIAAGALEKDEIAESADIIVDQARRMTALVRQFLDFARRRLPDKAPTAIDQVIAQVIRVLEPTAQKSGVSIEAVLPKNLPAVCVDAAQIQQVLINLAINGIQAMPTGGRLEIGVRRSGRRAPTGLDNSLVVDVRDQGTGIDLQTQDHIFEPFFTTKAVGQGTGLGLSIVRGIVQEHRGRIEVQSAPGQGTCFSVFLPLNA